MAAFGSKLFIGTLTVGMASMVLANRVLAKTPGESMSNSVITGKDFELIEIAVPEARKRQLDLSLYRISVTEDDTIVDGKKNHYFIVSFIDAQAPRVPTGPGNPGKLPGLEVKIDRATLAVVGAFFIR